MKTVLRLVIQIFWVFLGCVSLWLLIDLGWRFASGHWPNDPLGWLLLFPMIMAFAAFILCAWCALFRFSQDLLSPVVLIATLIMWGIAMHGVTYNLTPLMSVTSNSHAFLSMPFITLFLLFVSVAGAFKFYRFTLAAIQTALFPQLRNSAARFL